MQIRLHNEVQETPVQATNGSATNGATAPSGQRTAPPAPWQDVPMAKWNDWRWQLTNRLNSVEEMAKVVNLTEDEKIGLSAPGRFRVDITPYFASLMDRDDPNCPVRLQIMPTAKELVPFTSEMADSLNEDAHSPVPGLVHRYPDRVLMLVTTQCASYCRYCTRSRIVGDPSAQFSRTDYDAQIEYLERTPQVRDVLLSGGDPLTIPPRCWRISCAACGPSPTSRSSASAAGCPSSCPSASPRNWWRCCASSIPCG